MYARILVFVAPLLSRPSWLLLLFISIVLAVIGPFGTFNSLSFLHRIFYWLPVVLSAPAFVYVTHWIVQNWIGDPAEAGPRVCHMILFSMLFTPALWMFSMLFSAQLGSWALLGNQFLYVFAVSITLAAVEHLVRRNKVDVPPSAKPRLFRHLPEGLDTAIVRLTVDDHYVIVFMEDGTTHRLLMRFRDAVREMDEQPGTLTHRSHWVSAMFMTPEYIEDANREFLVLKDGTKVPVSKTYREKVRRLMPI